MGCDGGTIPRRDELVRVKKKPEQKDKDAEREFLWHHCAITQQRLQEPIVMCGLGRLYSKQNIIELLLEKEKMPDSSKHIKNMKDIKTLNLTPNPAYIDEDKTEGLLDARHSPFICKLIGLEMSGKFRFVALWTCGCVISERAFKQLKRSASLCPLCQTAFSIEDVIVLNGNDGDLDLMRAKMEMRNAKRKATPKEKKLKHQKTELKLYADSNLALGLQEGPLTIQTTTTIPRAAYSSKIKSIGNPKRLGEMQDSLQDPELKRLKTDYSVANDPGASEVYKSLFTTHKSEQEQSRAHWVTYNPFYN